ncbi:hypothetical protein RJ55_08417 [Drechmeria coniospora]|nr:hypothetical protein RJ55_08417 [Drechmeria coniospora]
MLPLLDLCRGKVYKGMQVLPRRNLSHQDRKPSSSYAAALDLERLDGGFASYLTLSSPPPPLFVGYIPSHPVALPRRTFGPRLASPSQDKLCDPPEEHVAPASP